MFTFNSHWINTMYRCVIAALAAACLVAPAAAQLQRNFPQHTLRGSLVMVDPPEIMLNGQPALMSLGVRIRSPRNMLELSGALVGQTLLVHYTLDSGGLVKDVWVLTPEEAQKKPWPATPQEAQSWSFNPVAQTWTKP